jgi:hypothetical protein
MGAVTIVTGFSIGQGIGFFEGDLHVVIGSNPIGDLHQIVIDGILIEVAKGVRHKVLAVLFHLGGMTGCAILRGDDYMDFSALMFKGIVMFTRVYSVAFGAADHHICHSLRCLGKGDPPFLGGPCQCFLKGDLGVSAPFPVGNCPGGC